MKKSEFIPTIAPIVQAENKKRGNPLYNSVVIAQAICESGWGQSTIMMKANAIFGIKATKSWKGKIYNAKTQECYDGKNYSNITACFRAYESLDESIKDYFDLICNLSRYANAIHSQSPLECITAIKNGGYATSPSYINTIMEIIKDNNLTKYDKVQNVENSVENPSYIKGNVYTLQVDLNVRENAGTEYKIKKFNQLTIDGKKHAYIQENAVLKKGTKVTCLKECKDKKGNIWLQIPSGFIAGFYDNKIYVK